MKVYYCQVICPVTVCGADECFEQKMHTLSRRKSGIKISACDVYVHTPGFNQTQGSGMPSGSSGSFDDFARPIGHCGATRKHLAKSKRQNIFDYSPYLWFFCMIAPYMHNLNSIISIYFVLDCARPEDSWWWCKVFAVLQSNGDCNRNMILFTTSNFMYVFVFVHCKYFRELCPKFCLILNHRLKIYQYCKIYKKRALVFTRSDSSQ